MSDPVAAILSVEPGKVLFRGKVVDVDRRTTEGFLRGTARVAGIDDDRGSASCSISRTSGSSPGATASRSPPRPT